ncbi:(d)CMP kinase [Alloiococcus sp. CFN-8]|uniref:(d)CMP kinase n=1 Tax=Alloiococcus sp. CFN-8 TaxID=3416081 RepID=UPI003CEB7AD2
MKLSVAIDGPAGAGKSTIAKLVAKRFHLNYINTGAMYRAITYAAIKNEISHESVEELCSMIDELKIEFKGESLYLNDKDITEDLCLPEIAKKVSFYASIPEIRKMLVKQQRRIAENSSVIMDGRDIGTVVLKDAPFKFYLTASADKRAERRYLELQEKGIEVDYAKILHDIKQRDHIDMNRDVDPLRKAEDAIEVDTSDMNIEEVVEKLSCIINNKLNH